VLEKAEYAGTSHLLATRSLVKYNNYVFDLICRGLKMDGELLEFGPGLGDFLERFKAKGKMIDAVENEPQFFDALKPLARRVVSTLDELPGQYDGIVSVNVLEHIEDDRAILRDLYAKLKPGGILNLYLPAGQILYGHLDALVHHYRRYDRKDLVEKVKSAGFHIDEVINVDALGWLAFGIYKITKYGDGTITPGSMTFYDNVVFPWVYVLDPLVGRSFGRSIYLRARKP
jgi:2-polyprenyl-3-methyl-5-hydroxy-6-metoxy-1,4-benzoquinol methylase